MFRNRSLAEVADTPTSRVPRPTTSARYRGDGLRHWSRSWEGGVSSQPRLHGVPAVRIDAWVARKRPHRIAGGGPMLRKDRRRRVPV